MIVYEVTATVRLDLCNSYERYMQEQHISDVLATGSFERASFERSTQGRYRIRYMAPDREALDRYMNEDSPRLRQDFAEHFPEGVELSREEWSVLDRVA